MCKAFLSCLTAVGVIAAVTLSTSQKSMAGGDLIAPVERTNTWSGFFVGGGLGIQQLKADIDVSSKSKSRSGDYKCGEKIKKFNGVTTGKINKSEKREEFAWNCVTEKDAVGNYGYHKKLGHHYADFDFNASDTTSSDWTLFGTVMLGYDYQISSKFVVGAFADVDFGSNKADFSFSHTGLVNGEKATGKKSSTPYGEKTADISGHIENDYSVTLGARAGYLINEKTLAYGLIGYTRTSLSGAMNFSIGGSGDDHYKHGGGGFDFMPVNMSKKFSENVNGLTVGVGGERKITDRWSARFEYRYTWLGDINDKMSYKAFSDGSVVNGKWGEKVWAKHIRSESSFNIDPHINSFRFLMSYKFD